MCVARTCTNLRVLHVRELSDALTDAVLVELSLGCPRLVRLSAPAADALSAAGVAAAARGLRALTRLDLAWCPALDDHAVHALLRNCPLAELVLTGREATKFSCLVAIASENGNPAVCTL